MSSGCVLPLGGGSTLQKIHGRKKGRMLLEWNDSTTVHTTTAKAIFGISLRFQETCYSYTLLSVYMYIVPT